MLVVAKQILREIFITSLVMKSVNIYIITCDSIDMSNKYSPISFLLLLLYDDSECLRISGRCTLR